MGPVLSLTWDRNAGSERLRGNRLGFLAGGPVRVMFGLESRFRGAQAERDCGGGPSRGEQGSGGYPHPSRGAASCRSESQVQ